MTAHVACSVPAPNRFRVQKRKLMWSSAAAALAVVAGTPAQQARAQAFQGTPTLPNPNIAVSGSATRTITSGTTETITVGSSNATINWIPNDNDGSGPIDFLPTGNVATFTNDPNTTADFTVLNRIVPADTSRPILLNGTVISQLQDLSSNTTAGGKVWFYSPGGIVVGATAVFDVGGLLLTVNDPTSWSTTATGFTGNFAAASNSTASVTIDPGAKITASPENSYVALVAPRVVQGGDVSVNGSAAYVAGEDVTLTMNQGLFDITVNVGSSDPNNSDSGSGIVHTGTTGGPSSSGAAGDNHRIYMVAVPKNQAMTMLLGGNVGFQPAASASVVNGVIVLAAGSNVAETSGTLAVTSPGTIDADLLIRPGTYSSNVRAFARGDITANADSGDITFLHDVSLTSLLAGSTGIVSLGASGGNTLGVGGDLLMQTNGATFSSGAPEELNITVDGGTVDITGNATLLAGAATDGTHGDVEIIARDDIDNQGLINVGGTTFISTSASASTLIPAGDSADSFAGNITIDAIGGDIALHNTTLFASANGQDNNGNGNGNAGSGNAGTIDIEAFNNGSIAITGDLSANADGIGGNLQTGGLFGGSGIGGTVNVRTDNGTIDISGNAFLSVLGTGGDYIGAATFGTPEGGFGRGGDARIVSGGPGSITIHGSTTMRADGVGGDGQTGGQGQGGIAGIEAVDGLIALGPSIDISAQGTGGNANASFGGRGGDGSGGYAFINATAIPPGIEQFVSAGTITGGNATIDASGTGGSGGAGNGDNIAAGAGGDGFGGQQCRGDCFPGGASAAAQVDGASLSLGNVTLRANGTGGAGGTGGSDQPGGTGGNGFGGSVETGLFEDAFFQTGATDGTASYGAILGFANGTGGAGGVGGSSVSGAMPQGDGGNATGGDAFLWTNALVTASSVTFSANANGGDGATGGQANGGSSSLTSFGSEAFLHIFGNVVLEASAASGDGSGGSSGSAFGGSATILGDGGDVTIDGTTELYANGDSEDGISGGFGQGGGASVTAQNGSAIRTASLFAQATGQGGNGSSGPGGEGDGGTARATADFGSSITTGDLTLDASGRGGDGADGGLGFGGRAEAQAFGFGSLLQVDGLATVMANGTGGAGGALGSGGNGFGGYAAMLESGFGGVMTINNAAVSADGIGGSGGTGGNGLGGEDGGESLGGVDLGAQSGTFTVTGSLTGSANGRGGTGTTQGGAGAGGNVQLHASNFSTVNLGTSTILHADGQGGGASAGAAGSSEGGFAGLFANVSEVTAGDVTLTANGDEAGTVFVDIAGSQFTADSLTLHADGQIAGSADLLVESDIVFGDGVTILDSIFDTAAFTATADGATAGDVSLTVNSRSTADLGVAQLSALGLPGTGSITIDLGADTVFSDFAFGGIGALGLENTLLTADSLNLNTSGDVSITSVAGASIDVAGQFGIDAGGDLSADDNDEGGVIQADVFDWHANNVVDNFDLFGRVIGITADVDIDLTDAIVDADELIDLNAGNDIATGDLVSRGDILADAGGDITTADLTADGTTDLDADGNILFGDVDTDILSFSAGGTVTGGDILAKRKVTGDASGAIALGDISVGPGPEVPGDFSVGIASETSITVGDVNSFGRVGFATLGDLITGDITAGPLFLAMVSGDVTTGSITTAPDGRVYMTDSSAFLANGGVDDFDPAPVLAADPVATGGSIFINGPVSTGRFQAAAGVDLLAGAITAGQSIEASAGNNLFTGDLDAGTTVDLTAGNNIAVNNVDAGTSATFTADGVAIFQGTVSAPTITVTSADIDITGQLGVFGVTNLLTLNAVSDGAPILIGGVQAGLSTQAEGLQYWLSNDEEIQAGSIVFNALGEDGIPTPDVLVSDYDIAGSQTAGGGAHHVELNTDGRVLFSGTLAYSGTAATDDLEINAGDIQVNTTDGGRIAVVGTNAGEPSGLLTLNADNIWVGDQALLDNLNDDVNFAGRDDAVGTNNGPLVPEGYLLAGGMTLSVGNTLFVQNSGSAIDFAGITVGAGGLTVRTTGEAPAQVVAYGRKDNGNGTFTTNKQFFKLVDFGLDEGSTYTDLSEFNECLINSGCGGDNVGGGPGPEDILGPIDLMSDPQETTEGTNEGGSDGFRDELIDTSGLGGDELVDEGVTSGGDNNQWGDVCPADPLTQRCVDEKDGSGKQER